LYSASVEKIEKGNNKLKTELLTVIATMEGQLDRVKSKREARLAAEREASKVVGARLKHIKVGAKKMNILKREVEMMWSDLENTYNLTKVTALEN